MCIAIRCRFGRTDSGRDAAGGAASVAQCGIGHCDGSGVASAGIQRHHGEEHRERIRETQWPGRFQVIAARPGWPEMVIDVAHNPAGAWALRSALSERYEDRPLIFVFGAMRDKAISEMAKILFPLADRVIADAAGQSAGGLAPGDQEAGARTGVEFELVEDVQRAVDRARELSRAGTVVVITGSIYLVGE